MENVQQSKPSGEVDKTEILQNIIEKRTFSQL